MDFENDWMHSASISVFNGLMYSDPIYGHGISNLFFRKWSTLGFCGLYAYFGVIWKILPNHQMMSKQRVRLSFCYPCSPVSGELRVHALLACITSSCCSLAFLVLDTFFFSAPNTREEPNGESRVSSMGWRAAVSLLEWIKMDSGSGETLSPVLGMIYRRSHSLVSVKTECKQCKSLHWVLANGPSQSTVKGSKKEVIVIWRTVSICVAVYMQWSSLQVLQISASPLTHTCLKGKPWHFVPDN